MARRQTSDDDEGGLDSLLDTLTNVVGILVLVLIVMQMSIADVVARITTENKIDEAKITELTQQLALKTEQKEQLESDLVDPLRIDPERQQQELKLKQELLERRRRLLQEKQQQKNEYALKLEQDRETAEKNRQEIADTEETRKQLEATLAAALDKKAELQAKLATTPRTQAPADVKISIPNPRPAPPGAEPLLILCVEDRLYPMATEFFRKNAEAKAKLLINRFGLDRNPIQGINPEIFTQHWEKLGDQDDFFDVEYYVQDERYPRIRLIPREGRGATIRQLNTRSSRIRSANYLGAIDPTQSYARFYVLPDSYEAYVLARRFFTEAEMLAGWEPQPADWQYTTSVPGGIELGPPRPKPATPPAPRPPAKPQNVID
ncbi:hypothetical protein [Candidatus Laterigemmans baculatus]|uniref:hypothetical protein n=1 Tax=Candidatus Laterigemmans baculatus TaxID=2770505 RepID=UPI0013D9584F|nr:hypothetical protein [Candidatus Laterigemmans baculatus]